MECMGIRRPRCRYHSGKTANTAAGARSQDCPNDPIAKTVHVARRIADGAHHKKGRKINGPKHTLQVKPRHGAVGHDNTGANQGGHETVGGRSISEDETNGSSASTTTGVDMKVRAADADASAATRTTTSGADRGREIHGIGAGVGYGVQRIHSTQSKPIGLG